MSIPAYLRHTALTILFLLATVNFTKTTLNVIESSKRLEEADAGVTALKEEKGILEDELSFKKTAEFVEQEARNKLGLVRPGEEVFVTSTVLGDTAHNEDLAVATQDYSNFKLWIDLFF